MVKADASEGVLSRLSQGRPSGLRPQAQQGASNRNSSSRLSTIVPPAPVQPAFNGDRPTIAVELPFEVVSGDIPPDMLERLKCDFTQDEVDRILARCHRSMAPRCEMPACLIVLGPSAVGKSYITEAAAAQLFGSYQSAVVVDGEVFRDGHSGWNEVCLHGMKRQTLHQDAWTIFKNVKVGESGKSPTGGKPGTSITQALKTKIFTGAIRDRQNIIVSSCANQPEKLQKDMDMLVQAGYEMHAVCLWAPLSETRTRGEPRSVREGKRWTGECYEVSTRTVCEIATRWHEGLCSADSPYKTIALWDNTTFPARQLDLEDFTILSGLSNEEADEHAWELRRPRTSYWGKLRAAHRISHAFQSRIATVATQTDLSYDGAPGGILSMCRCWAVTQAATVEIPGTHAEMAHSLREQRVRGRCEGALGSALTVSAMWGALVLWLLLSERCSDCSSATA